MTAQPATAIEVDALIDAVVASVQARFPDLRVAAYLDDRKNLELPACLIGLVDIEPTPDTDPGTEQLSAIARFEAHLVLGFRSVSVKRQTPKAAAALAVHLHGRRILTTGPAQVTMIEPDDFAPELDRFEVWRVEWFHDVHLGDSVWTNDGTIPGGVLVSIAPDIGPENEAEYHPAQAPEPSAGWLLIDGAWNDGAVWSDSLLGLS